MQTSRLYSLIFRYFNKTYYKPKFGNLNIHKNYFHTTRATNEAPKTAPPAEGFMTEVAQSKFVKSTREEALNNPELEETNVAQGETKKMNMFQSINDAMRIALDTDDTAGRIKDLSNGKF
ncbi:thiamine diphosphate-binding protein, partial [Gigaspora margarita]